jgi:hypothetical protein
MALFHFCINKRRTLLVHAYGGMAVWCLYPSLETGRNWMAWRYTTDILFSLPFCLICVFAWDWRFGPGSEFYLGFADGRDDGRIGLD